MGLEVSDGVSFADRMLFAAGREFVKEAAEARVAYNLQGTLYKAKTGWVLLSVPNAFAIGIFKQMHEPGIELPPGPDGSQFNAHVSVIRPDELELVGGADRVTERGKSFRYTLGRLYEIEPDDPRFAKAWYVKVHSPELQALRRSYGLSSLPHDGEYDFHITVAVRRTGVLGRNDSRKQPTVEEATAE